ncbi:MAG: anion permease [Clostridiales bacterium]|nr:anion permease [Clostridiales bacterium]MDY3745538.1 anion permease [Lachnospiraceae bacterium]
MNEKAVQVADEKLSKKQKIGWLVAIAVPVILLLIPCTEAYTLQIKEFFAILSFVMIMFAFELFSNNMIPSIILSMLFLILNLGTPAQIFSGWANNIPWAMIGSLILVGVMNGTNLLKRMSYGLIMKTNTKVTTILIIFNVIGLAMSTVLAVNIGFPLAVLSLGLCQALNIEPNSDTAAKIVINSYFSMTVGGTAFLGALTLMGIEVIGTSIEGFNVTYVQYFIHNWPFLIYGFVLMLVVNKMFKNDQTIPDKSVLKEEHAKLGKMDFKEKKLILLLAVLFVCMLLNGVLKIQIGFMILIAAVVCFLPFVKLGTNKALSEIKWPLAVFMTACIGIGVIAANVGAGQFVADMFMPLFGKLGQIGSLILTYIIGVLMNFVLTPLAAQSTMLIPLSQVGANLGISPNIILYVFQNGVNQALLPYEIAFALFYFSLGYMKLKQFAKAGLIMLVTNFIWIFVVMIPYWKLIGIFGM